MQNDQEYYAYINTILKPILEKMSSIEGKVYAKQNYAIDCSKWLTWIGDSLEVLRRVQMATMEAYLQINACNRLSQVLNQQQMEALQVSSTSKISYFAYEDSLKRLADVIMQLNRIVKHIRSNVKCL